MATDYYRLRVQGLHQTEYNECVMHFRGVNLDTAEYIENAGNLCTGFTDEILPLWLGMLPESYQLCRVSASKASTGGGAEVSQQYPFDSQPGLVSGGAASQQLCPVVRLIPPMGVKTAGKFYLPCVAESQVAANVLSSTWLSNLSDMMGPLLLGFTSGSITWDLVIHSRALNIFSEALSYDTSPVIGFQRRRQRSPL